MAIAVPLQVEGVDLDDEQTVSVIGEKFSDHLWSSIDGLVTMTIFVDHGDIASQVLERVRSVQHHVPGAKFRRVHRDLVTQSDIAVRVGVSREAVRKWTHRQGEPSFPIPFDTLGGGEANASKVWLWSDIVDWLQNALAIDMDESFASDQTVAEIDACLAKARGYLDREWQTAETQLPEIKQDSELEFYFSQVQLIVEARMQQHFSVKTVRVPGATVRLMKTG